MAYKCSFLDSEIYSAQDVNDIFARITSGGVVFTDTGYTLGDLNVAQSDVTSSGVTKDTNSCRVVKGDDGYKISKGACFMNDGSAIIFDEDGQEIEVTSGIVNYVYLKRNTVANTIDIVVSENAGDEESIPLAQITEDGEILDRRKYSMAKVEVPTRRGSRDFTVQFEDCSGGTSETVTVELEDGAFSHLILWDGMISYGEVNYNREACGRNLIALVEGEEVYMPIGKRYGDEVEHMYFKKDGQRIHIYVIRAASDAKFTFEMGVV